jgi:DnaK suppressor protein
MKKADLEKYRKLLLKKRQELLEEMTGLRRESLDTIKESTGDLSSYSYHMADLGTDAGEREKNFLLASKSGRFLYHIDEALRRIENGTYGKCHECGQEISKSRLQAVPHARLCIDCKSKEEEKKARNR